MGTPAVLENLAWSEEAMRAIEAEALTGREFEAFDLQARQGLENPASPARWGPIFRTAAQRGVIHAVGFRTTRRPTRRGGIARVWIGAPRFIAQKNGSSALTPEPSNQSPATN